ncbi:MAG: hypothetical protein M1831_001618 [Alyxoria varia]|nr:MAG: hypothetical protein M1831_001618 [Alyxoria varia]
MQFNSLSSDDIKASQSTKVNAVVEDVERYHGTCNALIFSCWKTTLQLVAQILLSKGITAAFIHGEVPLQNRKSILSSFRDFDRGNVLLMTLGTGAVGLNLFTARRIHIIEPQWNPAVEEQALGRAVRLGQTAEVTILKYVMDDTIETNVRSRQEKKLHLASAFGKQGSDKDEIKEIGRKT